MNRAAVERIAKAVLYEGYMLYPYRPSASEEPAALQLWRCLSAIL